MKIKLFKVINADYFSRNFSIMAIAFIVVSLIVLTDEMFSTAFIIVSICSLISVAVALWRILKVKSFLEGNINNQALAKVTDKSRSSKALYIFIEYKVNKETYKTKMMVPKLKATKQIAPGNTITVIYNPNNFRQVFMLELFLDKND